MLCLVTRFFDNGFVFALFATRDSYKRTFNDSYDQYVDSIGSDGDYLTIAECSVNMGFDLVTVVPMPADLERWTDITDYV